MKAGATIHIIYEILKTNNMLEKCFNSEDIFNNHTKIKNKDILIEKFHKKKGNNVETFEKKVKIDGWLNKHIKTNVIWFDKCDDFFRLKQDLITRLENERKNNGI